MVELDSSASHPVTRELAEQPSPVIDSAYKHREDLIDALLCAWTASLWTRHGFDRCQVLGLPANATGDPAATMIVPARPEQRLQPLPKSALSAAGEVEFGCGARHMHAKACMIPMRSRFAERRR